ncbi:hypothetical protein YUMDRAFT_06565, partial [Streptomyces sp. OspMP-M45]
VETVVRLLANPPTPEGARLAALVLDTCPPSRTGSLQQRIRAGLGPPPSTAAIDQLLPPDPGPPDPGPPDPGPPGLGPAGSLAPVGQGEEPAASWLRVWAWSPVLPAPVLAGFAPLLDALRRLRPAGPTDPRAVVRPRSRRDTALVLEDLRELAAADGPLAAAAVLAAAPDTGAPGYATVLRHLVSADPGAWTADVPAVLDALARPDLGAFYLAAAARHPDAFPTGPAESIHAALTLTLTGALPPPADPHVPDAAEHAIRAWSGLLETVWRTGTDLDGALPAVLARLHTLAAPLTLPSPAPQPDNPATPTTKNTGAQAAGGLKAPLPAGMLETQPALRALDCLLGYAASRATRNGTMPGDVLHLVADVLAARGGEETAAAVLGAHLPLLHHHAPDFAATHPELYALTPGQPSPAAAWLADGPGLDPLLLAALDRSQLLAVLREDPSGGAAFRVVLALMTGHPGLLGTPVTAWRELATGQDGPASASAFLGYLALFTIMSPAARTAVDTEQVWWTAALDAGLPPGALAGAGLPPGALAGAGHFATAFPDAVWLPLARRSAAHTPAQDNASQVAERAAAHPQDPDALLLTTHLLTGPGPAGRHDPDVRHHARALLHAAEALPAACRPAEATQLRRALIEAGEVDLAQAPATAG